MPLGITAIDFSLSFLGVAGIRVARRFQVETRESRSRRGPAMEEIPTLLIGAGQAGLLVSKELRARPDLAIRPIGFID